MFKYITYLFVLMFIFLGVVMHETDIENNIERNIYNFSESEFIWNSSLFPTEEFNYTNISMTDSFSFRVRNIIFKTVDLVGYTAFQVVKVSLEFGYEKAYNYEPESFISIAKLIFVIAILSFIFPIIVPVLAILYLLFEGAKWLIKKIQKSK